MKQFLATQWELQRHTLILWSPVVFGWGIWFYFFLPFEPPLVVSAWLAVACLVFGVSAWFFAGFFRVISMAILLLTSGYLSITYRSISVAAPVLEYRYYGPVEGRIVKIDKSGSDARRILLDRVVMTDLRGDSIPAKVRVSLFGYIPDEILQPGNRVAMVANMSAPGAPAEPGGFDFRIMAWFDRIGAVGYTRNPVLEMRPYIDNGRWLDKVRATASTYVFEKIGGQNGAFAGAILTGDRSRIDPTVLGYLRASNLAHLLAISGLHMGLLTGFVYLIFRYGLALSPRLALFFPVKKIGAVVALAVGLGYLFISGGNVATQRAFIMVAVVLVAVIIDRPAFTLRAVALAAMIVLIARPESLNEAGFQMSFAATTGLIGVFDWLRSKSWWQTARNGRFARLMPLIGLVITSAVAGLATAPISAYHFNQLSNIGLMANILSVPMMGLVVMPAAVLAGILSLVGLDGPIFWIMGQGIGWILAVAEFFGSLPMATTPVKSAVPLVLPLIAMAGCIFFLVQGRIRFVGLMVFLVAIWFWMNTSRPEILVNENGSLIGLSTGAGRVLNKETAYRFSAHSWLENDGDGLSQTQAFDLSGLIYEDVVTRSEVFDDWTVVLNRAKKPEISCESNQILIAPKWQLAPAGDCFFVGAEGFQNGAISIKFIDGQPALEYAAPTFPRRPWNDGGKPYQ